MLSELNFHFLGTISRICRHDHDMYLTNAHENHPLRNAFENKPNLSKTHIKRTKIYKNVCTYQNLNSVCGVSVLEISDSPFELESGLFPYTSCLLSLSLKTFERLAIANTSPSY